jgi:hypothetical protein
MTLVFECDGQVNWKPGLHRGRGMVRLWWLWFAISWLRVPFPQLVVEPHDWVLDDGTRWQPR